MEALTCRTHHSQQDSVPRAQRSCMTRTSQAVHGDRAVPLTEPIGCWAVVVAISLLDRPGVCHWSRQLWPCPRVQMIDQLLSAPANGSLTEHRWVSDP